MSIEIRRATASEWVDLRHEVLRAGLPRETAIFPGDDDASSIHWIATERGRPIGCVTLHLNQWNGAPAWQLRGMAVAPGYRNTGVGASLLTEVESAVHASPVHQLWCNARTPAAAFYEKHGWQIVSKPFDIPNAGPHVKMIRRLVL